MIVFTIECEQFNSGKCREKNIKIFNICLLIIPTLCYYVNLIPKWKSSYENKGLQIEIKQTAKFQLSEINISRSETVKSSGNNYDDIKSFVY